MIPNARGITWRALNLLLTSAALASAASGANFGLRYDGIDDVLRPESCLPLSRDAPFTLELWVLRSGGNGTWEEIADSRGFSLFIHSSSRLFLNLASPGQGGAPDCCYLGAASMYTRYRSASTVPVGSWVHLAVVWNGSYPIAYVDGVADSMSYDITQESFTCCDFGDSEPCYTPDPALITVDISPISVEPATWGRTKVISTRRP